MIELIRRIYKFRGYKDQIIGFVDGERYLNKNKELIGFLDGNVYKISDGYPILTLNEDGIVIDEDGNDIGYLESETFYFPDKNIRLSKWMRKSFSKEKGEVYNYKGAIIGSLNGKIENLKDLDYFGIITSYFELGA